MNNITNLTSTESDIYEIIKLYNDLNPNNESCWKQPVFYIVLIILATQYLKPLSKHYMKKRQQLKDSSRKNTSTES